MLTLKDSHGNHKEWKFIPQVPSMTKPKIRAVRFIGGIKHYITQDEKIYVAEIFNRVFGTKKQTIKPPKYKGKNPNGKLI